MIRSIRNNYIVDYLNKKYGDQDFKIEKIIPSIDPEFGDFWIPIKIKPDGYIILVSTSKLEKPFMFSINSLNPFDLKDTTDSFINDYYTETVNNHFSSKYNLKSVFMISESKILEKYKGKIPTMDELIESDAIVYTDIYVDYKGDSLNNSVQYMKELLLDFAKFLKISKPMHLDVYLSNDDIKYEYNVTMHGDAITINGGPNPYTYGIYDLR